MLIDFSLNNTKTLDFSILLDGSCYSTEVLEIRAVVVICSSVIVFSEIVFSFF